MKPCNMENREGRWWCHDHQKFHNGHLADLARDPGKKGIAYRNLWTRQMQEIAMIPAEPSFLQKATSYLTDTARHVANGLKVTPEPIRRIRLETCQACPQFDAEQQSCRKCGCKAKGATWLTNKLMRASSECPLKKWLKYEPTKVDYWLQWLRTGSPFPQGLTPGPEAIEAQRLYDLER